MQQEAVTSTRTTFRRPLRHYYALEAASSTCWTLFLYSVFFWSRAKFGFSVTENLVLGAVHGVTYILAVKIGGKLSDRVGYDRTISTCLLLAAIVLCVGWIPQHARWSAYVVVGLYTALAGVIWPALEAAIVGARDSRWSMPWRLGIFNIIWSTMEAVGYFASGPMLAWRPDAVLWVSGAFQLLQWIGWTLAGKWTSRARSVEDVAPDSHRGENVPRERKRALMRFHWVTNGLAYLMLMAFMALAPQMAERLKLPPMFTIWLASSVLFTRSVAFVVLLRWNGWHYHAGCSHAAMWAAPLALAAIFFSTHVLVVLPALIVFGAAIGLSYAGSLYYTIDYGEEAVGEHGGLHEAIIGIGVTLGPLVGAGVSALTGQNESATQAVIVGLVMALNLTTLVARVFNPCARSC
jgi:MFS family permease